MTSKSKLKSTVTERADMKKPSGPLATTKATARRNGNAGPIFAGETFAGSKAEVERIGRRLQTMRRAQGLTLADLAARASCSTSLLSRVENGHVLPSLSVLHRLVAGVGTSIATFLAGSQTESCMIVRAADRQEVVLGYLGTPSQGVRIEQIIPHSPERTLQGNLITISAGHGSAGHYFHVGEEAGFVVNGFLELTIDNQVHVLGRGDSFCFRSEEPHSFFNPGPEETVIVWINTPPTF